MIKKEHSQVEDFDLKKIAFICPRIPYPIDSGEAIKCYHTLRALAEMVEVEVFGTGESKNARALEAEIKNIKVHEYKLGKVEILLNLMLSILSLKPLQALYFFKKSVAKKIREGEFDANYVYTLRAWELRDLSLPSFTDLTDSLWLHYKDALKKTRSHLWRLIYSYENMFLGRYEVDIVKNSVQSFLVNKNEVDYYRSHLSKLNIEPSKIKWIRIGLKEELFSYKNSAQKNYRRLFFFGKMDYQPNVDAVRYFVESVLPSLPQDITFEIFGSHPSDYVLQLPHKDQRIKVHGFLNDPYIEIINCGALVAPMQMGGGVQNKILEAMALGLPVFTTKLAGDGLEGLNYGVDFRACLTKDEWIESVSRFLDSPEKLTEIALETREKVMRLYSWKAYRESIQKAVRGE